MWTHFIYSARYEAVLENNTNFIIRQATQINLVLHKSKEIL